MTIQLGYWAAFSAGVLSFLSPCFLPLIPGFMLYLSGNYDEENASVKRKRTMIHTLGFVIGFTLVFMLLGISASALGQILIRNQRFLARISGVFIIFFGLMMTGLFNFKFFSKDYRRNKPRQSVTFSSAILIGMSFAFGWTPCFGPILGSILAYTSATSDNLLYGIWMLGLYSLGMALPFLTMAFFINVVESKLNVFTKGSVYLKPIAGVFMMIIGLLIFMNKLYLINPFL